jgi:hypothetical protein
MSWASTLRQPFSFKPCLPPQTGVGGQARPGCHCMRPRRSPPSFMSSHGVGTTWTGRCGMRSASAGTLIPWRRLPQASSAADPRNPRSAGWTASSCLTRPNLIGWPAACVSQGARAMADCRACAIRTRPAPVSTPNVRPASGPKCGSRTRWPHKPPFDLSVSRVHVGAKPSRVSPAERASD